MGKPEQKNSSSQNAQPSATDATDRIPVSGRMKELRGPDLTDHQREIVSTWINTPTDRRSQRVFTAAWPYAAAINIKEKELASAAEPRGNAEKLLRELGARITPLKSQRAKEEQRLLVALCHEYIKENGAPTNHTEFIKWLRSKGVLVATRNLKDASGRSMRLRPNGARNRVEISGATVRSILRSVFGLKGRPGRKPGEPK
jgi:hypothetical protein